MFTVFQDYDTHYFHSEGLLAPATSLLSYKLPRPSQKRESLRFLAREVRAKIHDSENLKRQSMVISAAVSVLSFVAPTSASLEEDSVTPGTGSVDIGCLGLGAARRLSHTLEKSICGKGVRMSQVACRSCRTLAIPSRS